MEQLMTPSECSQILRISKQTLYGMVSRKVIPFKKPGSRKILRFSAEEIAKWIEERSFRPEDKIKK